MKAEDNFRENKNGTILQKDLIGIWDVGLGTYFIEIK